MNYYLNALRNYAVFSGRARRKEYWMFALFNFVFAVIALTIDVLIGLGSGTESFGIVSTIYALAVFIPGLSVGVRRLHDIGKRGTWMLVSFIPLIGAFALLAFMCMEGDVGANAYGVDPKAEGDPQAGDGGMVARAARIDGDGALGSAARRRAAHSWVMIGAELIALAIFFAALARIDLALDIGVMGIFLDPRNLRNLMMVFLPIALASVGAAIVFSRGSYDFSIGGVMSLSAVLAASLLVNGSPLAIPAAVAAALAVGAINAFCSGAAKKAGFLVTIVTAALARYVGMGISGYASIPVGSEGLSAATIAAFWAVLAIATFAAVLATRTKRQKTGFGRLLSIAWPYLFSSLLACAAGLFMMHRLNCATPGIGSSYELYTVFAIALSGSFFGARNANIPGVLLGALFASVVSNVLSLMNAPTQAQMICLCSVAVVWFLLNWLIARIMFPKRQGETKIK